MHYPHLIGSVGKHIGVSRCFPSPVPFGSRRQCRYYAGIVRWRRRYGFC